MGISLRQILVGQPLPTERLAEERLNKVRALAVFSSDALSSVAYATEEIILVLVLAGSAALSLAWPISLAIVTVLVIVAISYVQGIHAYPSGGGAYVIAKENLGVMPGLVAGAALLIDYVLTVAVSMSAGVAAITSAIPGLRPWRVELGVALILLVTVANMRGVRESGSIFAIPTYAFVASLLAMIATGVYQALTGQIVLAPSAAINPEPLQTLSLFLLLRAFSSGCTALTGIEAISNGVQAFKAPEAENASRTLIIMAVLLTIMFLGISGLTRLYGVHPLEGGETAVSQLARSIFGANFLYYAIQAVTALILILAANTSFNGFPRLASVMANDRFLPRQMSSLGDRLVFDNGITLLGIISALLLAGFGGDTHRLIPLYTVGVFISFTLAQVGLVRRSLRERQPHWRRSVLINGVGGAATGLVMVVVGASKFLSGAWVVFLLIPFFVYLFSSIHDHYKQTRATLSLNRPYEQLPHRVGHNKVIVPVSGAHRGVLKALQYAVAISDDVRAVMVDTESERTVKAQADWPALGVDVPLEILPSPYRSVQRPLLDYIEQESAHLGKGDVLTIVVPEFVSRHWWGWLLHNQTALLLKAHLLYRRTDHNEVVVDIPFYLED